MSFNLEKSSRRLLEISGIDVKKHPKPIQDLIRSLFRINAIKVQSRKTENSMLIYSLWNIGVQDLQYLLSCSEDKFWDYFCAECSSEQYISSVLAMAKSCKIQQFRTDLISQIFAMHKQGFHAGSAALCISQIEGIIVDLLVNHSIARYDATGEVFTNTGSKLSGLGTKIPKLRDIQISNGNDKKDFMRFCRSLEKFNFPAKSNHFTLSKYRNNILHGSDSYFHTNDRTSLYFIVLLSCLLYVFTQIQR